MKKNIKIIPNHKIYESFINIVPSSEFVPEWYRKSPSKMNGAYSELAPEDPKVTMSTYKKCTPFFDALTIGYTVFLTADIEVTRQDNGLPYIMWRPNRKIITEHSLDQWEGLPCPEGYSRYVYKWYNDFVLKTPKDYSLLFISPMNRFDLPFISINGVVDTDRYNLHVQFPFFIRDDFTGIIEKGTPIVQIVPIKRESWEREIKPYDPDANLNWEKFSSTIKRSYKNNFWVKKDYK